MKNIFLGLLILGGGLLSGCVSMERLPSPEDPIAMAEIPGIPECRIWGDDAPANEIERARAARTRLRSDPDFDPKTPIHFLAISGGAQEGAFGGGVLAGWTARGDRPEFKLVTGISSGSLLAPFAFLGSEYDGAIQEIFSRYSTKDIVNKRIFSALFRGTSLSSNEQLRAILKTYFTPVEMKKVAEAYAQGRALYIGSTNLDSVRPVLWDIGRLASSGHPGAYDLIIDIILASAAFPGIFPPILFDVQQNGKAYQELHVDGGLTSQVFAYSINANVKQVLKEIGIKGQVHVYVLRNAPIWPKVSTVKPSSFPILIKTAESMVNSLAKMDIHHIYSDALDNDIKFHLAYMPSDFREPEERFDPSYMKELYEYAFEKAKAGYPWEPNPPEFQNEELGE